MEFSVRALMGVQYLIYKLKFMITTLKMILTYVYNKGLNQNLRRIEEKKRKFSDSPRRNQRQQVEEDEPEKSLQKASKS